MSWEQVRLQVDPPQGWTRLEDVQPLTFAAPSGLRLRLSPMSTPDELDEEPGAEPRLMWALARSRESLGNAVMARISTCQFGLCATLTLDMGVGKQTMFWLLASPAQVLVVSLTGKPSAAELAGAVQCVESMRLVSAARYPN